MYGLYGIMNLNGNFLWECSVGGALALEEEGVRIDFRFLTHNKFSARNAMQSIEKAISTDNLGWIGKNENEWSIDLDSLKQFFSNFKELNELKWLNGIVMVEPEYEYDEKIVFNKRQYETSVCFYITTENKKKTLQMKTNIPIELQESTARFKLDYPENVKTAFIIMQFSNTTAHTNIANEIKRVLIKWGIIGLRADDKEYTDDLFANVSTYMHCCDFSIAVFERLLADDFNPNVSLEVGYMLGLKKHVCLLKDLTLKNLNTDLVGKLYKSFNTQNICGTIEAELEKWLKDKEFI